MATTNNLSQMDGMFKNIYADKMEKLVPDGVKLAKKIEFSKSKLLGKYFNMPVNLQLEHGFTYGGETGSLFTLNSAVAAKTAEAQVRGVECVLRSGLPYGSIFRSQNVNEGSFIQATKYVVQNMIDSFYKQLEVDMFYGQEGLGKVSTVSGNDIVIQTAEWATGIWAGAEGKPVEIRDSTGTLRGFANVAGVAIDTRTVTLDAMPASVASGDILWHKSAYGNQFAGLHKILTNTGSLFGISASTYSLWKSNTSAVTGSLDFSKCKSAISKAVNKGLEGELLQIVNPSTWDDMLVDLAAKRQFDDSYKSGEFTQGAESITFFSQNGKITIEPSIYCKEGYSYLIQPKLFERVGSTDVTFELPDSEGKFFRHLNEQNGVELRAYTDQAMFCKAPGKASIITGIVNS